MSVLQGDVPPSKKPRMDDLEGMERRILTLEMEKSQNVEKVKERVKILATHTEPNDSLLLITLDELARVSRKVNHKDAEVHEELYRQCCRMQGKINLSNLCLTVLGGQGADIVSKAVNKCVKESKSFDKADDSKSKGSPQEEQAAKFGGSPLAGLYPYPGPMFGPGYGFPGYGSFHQANYSNGFVRPRGGYRMPQRGRLACHFCESTDHLVKDCEQMKAAKRK